MWALIRYAGSAPEASIDSQPLGSELVYNDTRNRAEIGLFNLCARCLTGDDPYPLKPEHPEWLAHVLSDESWKQWRIDNPERVEAYTEALGTEG